MNRCSTFPHHFNQRWLFQSTYSSRTNCFNWLIQLPNNQLLHPMFYNTNKYFVLLPFHKDIYLVQVVLTYTSTNWSAVTEWFTHTLLLWHQTQAFIATLAGILSTLACLCQCFTDFICEFMISLNAPVVTIVLSVIIFQGSEETSWSQESYSSVCEMVVTACRL